MGSTRRGTRHAGRKRQTGPSSPTTARDTPWITDEMAPRLDEVRSSQAFMDDEKTLHERDLACSDLTSA